MLVSPRFALATLTLTLTLLAACAGDPKSDGGAGLPEDTGAVDGDGDGFTASEDCDDDDATINGGATEVCDGVDNDCDGEVDEGVLSVWYDDADEDGFGDASAPIEACSQPSGAVTTDSDCDDDDPRVFPSANELCNGVDDNCDGTADEGLSSTWYPDADGDGFGDDVLAEERCDDPSGWVQVGGDCDDTTAAANPGVTETCDEIDNDCDGLTDEGVTTTYWVDVDGDGYGVDDQTTEACSLPLGYATDSGDCDDASVDVNPSATELCNSVDDDCDGTVDEDDAADALTWHQDVDSDGYGIATVTTRACTAPSGYVAPTTAFDCDDGVATTNPGATETCNSVDDDCDGTVDEDDAVDAATWYIDVDSDGYGSSAYTLTQCAQPAGYVATATDCDDTSGTVYPGATEACNDIDDDCNGTADDGLATSSWYDDDDNDGYGDPAALTTDCSQPAGTVSNSADCDDSDSGDYPGAPEIVDNGDDEDCDGGDTCYVDADSDGYRPDTTSTTPSADLDCTDAGEAESSDPAADCDDADANINPGASERCNDTDDDCDTEIDELVYGATASCPAESCDDILDHWTAPDGTYVLDPDGSGATSYTCDMTTDGGGWTLVVDWDRVTDGDSKSDLLSHFSVNRNNLSTFQEQSSRLYWQDANGSGDVLSLEREVLVPNAGDVLYNVYYSGDSMEQSATYWYADVGGTDTNLECYYGMTSWSAYNTADRAERPSYYSSCADSYASSGNRTVRWSGDVQDSLSGNIDAFHFVSFHYDTCCDYSYLYKLEAWVR